MKPLKKLVINWILDALPMIEKVVFWPSFQNIKVGFSSYGRDFGNRRITAFALQCGWQNVYSYSKIVIDSSQRGNHIFHGIFMHLCITLKEKKKY